MSSKHDNLSSSDKEYLFTIEGDAVTAYFEVEPESIGSNDSFVIDGDQIILTKETSDGTRTTVFSDPDGDGFYAIASNTDEDDDDEDDDDDDHHDSGHGHGHKSFKFDIADGAVIAVYELDDGVWELKPIDDDGSETYTMEGDAVIHTETKPFGSEITRYEDSDGDGIYFRTAEEWIISPIGHSVAPKFSGMLHYLPTNNDDFIVVRGGEDSRGGFGADGFVVREAAHLRIEDFNTLENDELIFDTGLGLTSQEQLISHITDFNYDGQDFIVHFGLHVSITLVGVQPDEISWSNVNILS